ncbi:hypothetical protein VKT23_019029 [Stygiomarasmius scandens]|uniref:3'-5' exonuclease n=1 Tax=Marasmiellus scandens TaxID=2682957 RepID=A0ABR1IMD9_9AGAR
MMCALFPNRFGPEPFAALLSEMRHLRHSTMELIYLATCLSNSNQDTPPPAFSKFDDKKAYAGSHPTDVFCKSVFMEWMRSHRIFMDRTMASLPGTILKGDHTFKIIKYLARLSDVPTHAALYTVVNEYEECRAQALTLTKSLSLVKDMYKGIEARLQQHGHPPTAFMYTDNASNELAFHESATSSLGENVKHIDLNPFAKLPLLSLPSREDFAMIYHDNYQAIEMTCFNVLQSLDPDGSSKLILGFDIEYRTEVTGQAGPMLLPRAQKGIVDVIQISKHNIAYVFQVTSFWSKNTVPPNFLSLLLSSRVIKVGRSVKADLEHISEAWSLSDLKARLKDDPPPYIDLGSFAKTKGCISDSSASLSALSGVVLSHYLRKDDAIRLSDWSQSPLTLDQQNYAALDAYASWAIWDKLMKLPSVGLLITKESIQSGQAISLYAGKTVAANGVIAVQPSTITQKLDGSVESSQDKINITRTRIVITVQEVLKPGFMLTLHKATLGEVSEKRMPFDCAVNINAVRTRSVDPPQAVPEELSLNTAPIPDPSSLAYEDVTKVPESLENDNQMDDDDSDDDSNKEYGAYDHIISTYEEPEDIEQAREDSSNSSAFQSASILQEQQMDTSSTNMMQFQRKYALFALHLRNLHQIYSNFLKHGKI